MRNDSSQKKNNGWFIPLFVGIIIFNLITSAVGSGVGAGLISIVAVFIPIIIFFVIFINIIRIGKRNAEAYSGNPQNRYDQQMKPTSRKVQGNVYKEHPFKKSGEEENRYEEHPYQKLNDDPNVYGKFQKVPSEGRRVSDTVNSYESINTLHVQIEREALSKKRRDSFCPYCGIYASKYSNTCSKCRRKI